MPVPALCHGMCCIMYAISCSSRLMRHSWQFPHHPPTRPDCCNSPATTQEDNTERQVLPIPTLDTPPPPPQKTTSSLCAWSHTRLRVGPLTTMHPQQPPCPQLTWAAERFSRCLQGTKASRQCWDDGSHCSTCEQRRLVTHMWDARCHHTKCRTLKQDTETWWVSRGPRPLGTRTSQNPDTTTGVQWTTGSHGVSV
jgi:hypothetical protein